MNYPQAVLDIVLIYSLEKSKISIKGKSPLKKS